MSRKRTVVDTAIFGGREDCECILETCVTAIDSILNVITK